MVTGRDTGYELIASGAVETRVWLLSPGLIRGTLCIQHHPPALSRCVGAGGHGIESKRSVRRTLAEDIDPGSRTCLRPQWQRRGSGRHGAIDRRRAHGPPPLPAHLVVEPTVDREIGFWTTCPAS